MDPDRPADWLSASDALQTILAGVHPLGSEERPLLDALGSTLAEEVVSPVDLPPWNNSAMDGFAVRAEDVRGAAEDAPRVLRVVDDVPAGRFPTRAVGPGQATRVMTGAPVPEGADSVVRVEHTDGGEAFGTEEGRVRIFSDSDAGRHIRPRGEDIRRGQLALGPGAPLRAAEVAVAAAVGRDRLRVIRRPVVAVLASGDELATVEEFAEVEAGRRIVSTNSYALAAQLRESGIDARVLGIARDTPESLREHLERARGCDALITTAGISVGEHDYVRAVLAEMETDVSFWRVRIRPGSALAFGRVGGLDGIPWFGLPGNPVSTMVTFELFVRPALLRMCGHRALFSPTTEVVLRDDYGAGGELMHFPRVRLTPRAAALPSAHLTGSQGSGVATSMSAADALLVVPPRSPARAGSRFRAVLLGGAPPVEEPPF